jgi:N6-adenosine-specific RNA methylase IME4/ParB-like chromosome segregation protein Spo0J
MKINEVKINAGRRTVDVKKVKELAESIKQLGLLNPITVNEDGTLIAGMHRLEACKLLGYEEIKVNKINLNLLLAELAEIDENLIRNELHWLESDKQLKRRKAIYEELHPETKQGTAGAIGKHNSANEIISSAKTFTEDTADKLGQSQRNIQMSVARAENIIEEVEDDIKELDITKTEGTILARFEPEQQKKIIEVKKQKTDFSIKEIVQEIKKEEKKIEREEVIKHTKEKIEKEEIIKPSGNFSVIAIDPPWDYSEKGGTNNSNYDQDGNRGQVDYPTMTLEQIKNIELPAKEDSVIFLWTVHAFLEDAFELLRNWGFTYKATMVWDKEKMGMGRNIRLQCEFCLLATKGNPIIQGSATRDIMREPRRQHSRKPECFYEMVETITIGNRLDYFSRENRNGWSVYGADLNKFTND